MSRTAVLTGDLIASTLALPDATERAVADLTAAAGVLADWTGADTRLTRFRGDGWQIVLTAQPVLALRAAVFLIATLKARKGGLHTRVALALGEVDSLGTQDLSDARGDAFTRSGRGLDTMKPAMISADFEGMRPAQHGFIHLLDPLLARWTPEQAEAVSLGLAPKAPPQKDIARHLGISEQAVSLRLRGASADALHRALSCWEDDFEWEMP